MKGYKVFNSDWSCRGFQYEVGKTYKIAEKPKCCSRGFHFCERLVDCFNYYAFDPANKVAEVEVLGDIDTNDDNKFCTNKIKIIKELSWHEVLEMCNTGSNNTGKGNSGNYNTGNYNSGDCNSGDCNSGNYNSGDWNSGYCNSGDFNSGDSNSGYYNTGNRNSGNRNSGDRNSGNWNSGNRNSGNRNSGNRNSGDYNSGNRNSGDWNSGDYNSGDWNVSNRNSGYFNTKEHKVMFFNKPSNWTHKDWLSSIAKVTMDTCPVNHLKWVSISNMSEEEKAAHPEYKTTGGYLKEIQCTPADKLAWWNSLSEDARKYIQELPNFDEEIFLQCIGAKLIEVK